MSEFTIWNMICVPQCVAESGPELMVTQLAKYPIMHYSHAHANAKQRQEHLSVNEFGIYPLVTEINA